MTAGKGTGGGSDLGSLFNDLMKEAKKEVEAERKQQVDTETESRERAARELREREESRRREEAQRKLIEENRRRNEALAKRDRVDGDRKALSTAPHMRPVDEGPKPVAAPVVKVAPKKISKVVMAGLMAAGLLLGVGGAFVLQPEARAAFPDVDTAARVVVQQTSKAAAVEKRFKEELASARQQLSDLEKQFGGAGLDAKKLREELERARRDLDMAKAELASLKEAGTKPVVRGGRGGGNNGGLPTINGNVFK